MELTRRRFFATIAGAAAVAPLVLAAAAKAPVNTPNRIWWFVRKGTFVKWQPGLSTEYITLAPRAPFIAVVRNSRVLGNTRRFD